MSSVYITSDHHFSHRNIIEYANRPYTDVDTMDADLIKRWNAVVETGDTVFHLGDFGFGSIDRQRRIFDQLNGEKRLILGNHDGNRRRMERIGFVDPVKYLTYRIEDLDVHMVHNPANAKPEWKDEIVLYGHVHDKTPEKYDKIPTWVNCCVEHWDYRPVDIRKLLAHIGARIVYSILRPNQT